MGINIMLSLGSLVMLTTFLGSSNRVMLANNQIASQNEYYIAALSYGQSVLEEAKAKAYQGYFVTGSGPTATKTKSNLLGTETSAEKMNYQDTLTVAGFASELKFDDVDDYNGYVRKVNSPRAEGYVLTASVNWVDEANPILVSNTPTDYKRMSVKVTSPFFPKIEKGGVSVSDTVEVMFVFSR